MLGSLVIKIELRESARVRNTGIQELLGQQFPMLSGDLRVPKALSGILQS